MLHCLGTTALHDAAKYGKVSIAKLLIDKGADVHAKDRAGFTPLHVSAFTPSWVFELEIT